MGSSGGDSSDSGAVERRLREVIAELERREEVVRRIDEDLRRIEEKMRDLEPNSGIVRGDPQRAAAGEQLRRRLRSEVNGLRARRTEAAADVGRARERRALLEEELSKGGESD